MTYQMATSAFIIFGISFGGFAPTGAQPAGGACDTIEAADDSGTVPNSAKMVGCLRELRAEVTQLKSVQGLSPGTVIAFNGSECPAGFSSYADGTNRVIVGAGDEFANGSSGGNNNTELTLSARNLPAHVHNGRAFFLAQGPGGFSIAPQGTHSQHVTALDKVVHPNAPPHSEPIEIMPRYIALRWCEKD